MGKVENRLLVQRETYKNKKDGKEYWTYFIRGKVLGKDVRADIAVKGEDAGGYEILDLFFDDKRDVELVVSNRTMTDDKTGKVTEYTAFEVRIVDADGEEYIFPVSPRKPSDKFKIMKIHEVANAVKTA